jgi:hypothetical protein
MKLFQRLPQSSTFTEAGLEMNQCNEHCDLKLIAIEKGDRIGKVQLMLALIGSLWQNAIAAIIKEPELKVWQTQDRHGHIQWHVYDPWTGESISFFSEAAMLCWIENRYCR